MTRRGPQGGQSESFAKFYLSKMAISEGCGCNELVIRRGRPKVDSGPIWPALRDTVARLWRRISA